jgi:hypothetical protein
MPPEASTPRPTSARTRAPAPLRAPPSASLKKVLAYRNPKVVERFRREMPVTQRAANEVWLDTLRWLWLCGATKHEQPYAVTPSMGVIDEMWHAFVLFTADYTAFCQAHFGRYIHHAPNTHADMVRFDADLRADPERVTRELEKQRRAQYERVAEHLGPGTLKRWYVDYAVKYSSAVLRRLRRDGLNQSS